MGFTSTARFCALAAISFGLLGCASFLPSEKKTPDDAMTELSNALKTSADRASKARMELSKYEAYGDKQSEQASAAPKIAATALIDIDYVGPAEKAAQIIADRLGWTFEIDGKKRADRLVSLRHKGVDAIAVLRDIGVQCGSYCDIHAQIVEGGTSSVSFSFRD